MRTIDALADNPPLNSNARELIAIEMTSDVRA